ncbi:response regulator transcription factor [Roseobacter sp. GAI101]|uniref:response regulator transcription factor n=1 Tax=Roseobacter sp. (strain GAI101) TaxID=391589 RepID=UPI000307FD30|nr:response regulator [Roseobacter sp. GAI101]
MEILIVESQSDLGALWQRHLERQGMEVACVTTQEGAISWLSIHSADIIILDLFLKDGTALAVADYANYKQPKARIIFVTNTSFFSDGSIFAHCANASAFVPSGTPPEDLAALVEHCGSRVG